MLRLLAIADSLEVVALEAIHRICADFQAQEASKCFPAKLTELVQDCCLQRLEFQLMALELASIRRNRHHELVLDVIRMAVGRKLKEAVGELVQVASRKMIEAA